MITFLNKYIKLAVDFDRLKDKINYELTNSGKTRRLNAMITAKQHEMEKAHKILVDIYPDYKSGLIGREQYLALKEKYENLISKSEGEIKLLKSELKTFEVKDYADDFIVSFKKYDGIEKLTRDMVVELIENIFIYESGDIEIRLKCRDELNLATELFDKYKSRLKEKHKSE